MTRKKAPATLEIPSLVKDAIRDAVKKALNAEPKRLTFISEWKKGSTEQGLVFEMGGQLWSLEAGIDHILGCYSWMKDK